MTAANNNSAKTAKTGTVNAISGKKNLLTRLRAGLIKITGTAPTQEISDIHTTAG